MRPRTLICLVTCALICTVTGCGGGTTLSFTRFPRTVHLRVGDEVGVRKSVGECGSPWSTKPAVIAAESPPRQGDCSRETVKFKAMRAGKAEIHGALPCRLTECAAMGAFIPVVVGPD